MANEDYETNKALANWLKAANDVDKRDLAQFAGTSLNHLYHLKVGRRQASAALAANIDRASFLLHQRNPKLPLIYREDLTTTCQACEYAKACRGKKVLRGKPV